MDVQAIFGVQFVLSLVVWALIAAWLLAPWLATKPRHEALFWLTLPHAFRHVGPTSLVPLLLVTHFMIFKRLLKR